MLAEITPAAATCCTASSRVKAGMGQAKGLRDKFKASIHRLGFCRGASLYHAYARAIGVIITNQQCSRC